MKRISALSIGLSAVAAVFFCGTAAGFIPPEADLVATSVKQTVEAMITPTPTVSVKDIKIAILVNQTLEAYYTGTPTPLPKPGNLETAVYGTLEALKPTATLSPEDAEIATAVHQTVQALLPTATPTMNEVEPLRQTIAALGQALTKTAAATPDSIVLAQTISALNATISAPKPPTAPTQPPVWYPPVTVVVTSPPNAPCHQYRYVADLTVPDGSVFGPNEPFTKTWRIQNTGSCTWNAGYYLQLFKGTKMGSDTVNLNRSVGPGETVDISINLTAPASPGTYRGNFTMFTPDGMRFLMSSGSPDGIWAAIRVQGSAPVPSPTPAVPASDTWSVHVDFDLNGGHWPASDMLYPGTMTASVGESIGHASFDYLQTVAPEMDGSTFKGWSVRFTDSQNGNVIYDSGADVWDLNHPFDYYPGNPREMNCLMIARWEGGTPPESGAGTWTVYIELDNMYGIWPWENDGVPEPDEYWDYYYKGVSAPIWTSISVDGIKAFEPTKPNAEFLGWAVRFTDHDTGEEIWDSGEEVWDLDRPFDYYPDNPREMNCLMRAVWDEEPSSWSVHVSHDTNSGYWGEGWGMASIDPYTLTAPVGQSMPQGGLDQEKTIHPGHPFFAFKGWSVRFTDSQTGDVIYDSGDEIWDLDKPFDYYPGNPPEMDCVMTAQWEASQIDEWTVNCDFDLNGGKQSSGTGWLSGRDSLYIIVPFTKSAPFGESIPVKDAVDFIDLYRTGYIFRGWSVRFTNPENGDVIYDSYPDVWNLDNPFDYYPDNPLVMNCLLTAQWMEDPFVDDPFERLLGW